MGCIPTIGWGVVLPVTAKEEIKIKSTIKIMIKTNSDEIEFP